MDVCHPVQEARNARGQGPWQAVTVADDDMALWGGPVDLPLQHSQVHMWMAPTEGNRPPQQLCPQPCACPRREPSGGCNHTEFGSREAPVCGRVSGDSGKVLWVPDLLYLTFFFTLSLSPTLSFPGIPAQPPHRATLPSPQFTNFEVVFISLTFTE